MKKLPSYTVIPPRLYVQREADRQLAANISHMERPAYILVARQMGKTNLLLNAKRTIENDLDKVVYVDLSTSFSDERECFRRIIDQSVGSDDAREEELSVLISVSRKIERSPAREHEAELRILLKRLPGKLIIILDEIDSLTNADFSDRVFAHIRSVYFMRSNFPEFSRLTYVLSGVVEPNDIIKDKKISPFNIGEKIYLDDFNIEEVEFLVENAGLDFTAEEIQKIFSWTSGNPRMIWDICSALEDIGDKENRSEYAVDDVVQCLYLDEYDHAPIDHIRQLVADNSEVTKAVWDIVSGNGDKISASARTKLYLAGITKSAGVSSSPVFKNEIIAQALNREWLENLLVKRRSLLSLAIDNYERREYKAALELYEKTLRLEDGEDNLGETNWYRMAECAFSLGNYGDAYKYYSRVAEYNNPNSVRSVNVARAGCALSLRRYSEAINIFSSLDDGEFDEIYLRANLNLGIAYTRRLEEGDHELALNIFENFPKIAEKLDPQPDSIQSLKVIALYSKGLVLQKLVLKGKSEHSYAKNAFQEALDLNQSFPRASIMIQMIISESSKEERRKILKIIQGDLRAGDLKIENDDKPLSFKESTASDLFEALAREEMEDEIREVVQIIIDGGALSGEINRLLLNAGEQAIKRGDLSYKLLFRIALDHSPRGDSRILDPLRWVFFSEEDSLLERDYLEAMEKYSPAEPFNPLDLRNLVRIAVNSVNDKDWRRLVRAKSLAYSMIPRIPKMYKRNILGFYFVEFLMLNEISTQELIDRKSFEALEFFAELTIEEEEYVWFSEKDLLGFENYLKSFKNYRLNHITPGFDSYSRNQKISVRYKDGRVLEKVKFKVVEMDLRMGRCQVIDLGK